MAKVLIIDDDELTCGILSHLVEFMGHVPLVALDLRHGMEKASSEDLDVVFLDVRLPDGNGLEALPHILENAPSAEVIIITGAGDPDSAELAIKSGAWDYLRKPFTKDEVTLQINRVLEYRSKTQKKIPIALRRDGIVGNSPQLNTCLDKVAQASMGEGNVLITGETGTGKELFARAIHENSVRAQKVFVVVDCTVLPDQLVESVLFGHERGAFTGAHQKHDGLILQANGGTLFLDEVGELPLSLQRSFLRVLQERRYLPVGGKKEVASDFRVIAATNRDLDGMVQQGEFRRDLLFRLRGLSIHMPSLRERGEDVKELARHFVNHFCEKYGFQAKGISPAFHEILAAYDWPGNIRELANALETAITEDPLNPVLFPKHLPSYIRAMVTRFTVASACRSSSEASPAMDPANPLPKLKEYREKSIETVERQYLLQLMSATSGDIRDACRISGLCRARVYAMLKKYGVSKPSP
jgi:two-component system, NtrC family, response regulator